VVRIPCVEPEDRRLFQQEPASLMSAAQSSTDTLYVYSASHPYSGPSVASSPIRQARSEITTTPRGRTTRASSARQSSAPTIDGPPMQLANFALDNKRPDA